MRFILPVIRLVVLAGVLIFSLDSHATITVLRHYRLGDADPGAAVGIVATNSLDSQNINGANQMTIVGSPVYSADTAYFTSARSLQFSGTNFGSATVISNLTDNFGVEAWVKTTTATGSHFVVYNGDSGANGWGIFQDGSGNVWSVLFGSQTVFGFVPVTVNQWTHLALVRRNGLSTFYVNGVAQATDSTAPVAAGGALAVGVPPQDPSVDTWQGLIDEVRVFTFLAGAEPAIGSFEPRDLLHPFVPVDPLRIGAVVNPMMLFWPTNRSAVAETTTNLSSTNWITLSNPTVTNGQYTITNNTNASSAFYRLRRVPCDIYLPGVPFVTMNPDMDGTETFYAGFFPGQPGFPNTQNAGGYKMTNFLDGSVVNYFDASAAITNLVCDPADPPPSFRWDIFMPASLGGERVLTRGITGICGPVLRIAENSLPSFIGTPAAINPYWRVGLTITYQHAGQPPKTLVNWFRFEYSQTLADLAMFWACKYCPGGEPCPTFCPNGDPCPTCPAGLESIWPGVDCNP